MTLFDSMLGGQPERHAVVALSMLAAFIALAAVAWWRYRRAAARRPLLRAGGRMVEQRAWSYCPVCGRPRPTDASAPSPKPPARPVRDAITAERATATEAGPLPSDLLRRGWTRHAALDAEGRIVTPCDPSATAFSIWGAGNRAFDPGGETWREWIRHLTDILAERHGGMSAQRWNRDAGRTHAQVVAVAEEIERRMGLGPRPA